MPNFLHATFAALLLPLFITGGLTAPAPKISPKGLPYDFQELFTVKLNVGKILAPLSVPGGVLINEPITGGTVTGSAINGTILSGFAHPLVYGTGATQVQWPYIDVYGTTDDGQSFYIHEEGIGTGPSAQVTRIVSHDPSSSEQRATSRALKSEELTLNRPSMLEVTNTKIFEIATYWLPSIPTPTRPRSVCEGMR